MTRKLAFPICSEVVKTDTTALVKLSFVRLPKTSDCNLIISVFASKFSIRTPPSTVPTIKNSSELSVPITVSLSAVISISLKRLRFKLLNDSMLAITSLNSSIIVTSSELPFEKTRTVCPPTLATAKTALLLTRTSNLC